MSVIPLGINNRLVFPLACLAAVALVFVSEGSYRSSVSGLDHGLVLEKVRMDLHDIQDNLVNAETGFRGYLLTGQPEFLQPYDDSIEKVDGSLRSLERQFAAEPRMAQEVGALRSASEDKLAEMARTILLYREGKKDAARDAVASGVGRLQMDRVRALDRELHAGVKVAIESGRRDVYRTLRLSRLGVAVLSAVGLLALFMYLRQTFALKAQQLELKRVVQAERDRLEMEVGQPTAELSDLTHYLLTAREDERSRLARNLHDDLGSLLTSAKLDAARIKSRLGGKVPEALEMLVHLVSTLNEGIALGRRIIEDLRPSALSNLGLVETLSIAAREFGLSSGIEVHCDLHPVELDAASELMVFRLVQESFTNISKYAAADHVWLSMDADAGVVHVSVRDDGVGFDTRVKPGSAYGLLGMRFRVEAEGGTLSVQSTPGQGTTIMARIAPSRSGSGAAH